MYRLTKWLNNQCKHFLLSEKWLLTDNFRTGQSWKDQLSLSGHSTINLVSKTLRSITLSLVAEQLNKDQLVFADHATSRMIIHSLVSDLFGRQRLEYFDGADSFDSLSELLANSIRDMRLSGVEPSELLDAKLESAAKARDLRLIYQSYCDRLQHDRLADYAACLELATLGLKHKSITLPSDLVVLIPEELKTYQAEQGLLAAIATHAKILSPDDSGFNQEATRNRIVDRVANEELQVDYFAGLGEVNEVRGVLQRILSQKDGASMRLDQAEIICTVEQQYAPLILESVLSCIVDHKADEALPSIDTTRHVRWRDYLPVHPAR